MSTNRIASLVATGLAVLALGACGAADDGDAADEQAGDAAPASEPARDQSGADSDIEIGGRDAASEVDRSVSETLSELDAETRGGDTVVTLPERVLFAFGEHTLLPDSSRVLDDVAGVLTEVEEAPVQVNGHTDAVGSTAANQALSERRAQAVVDHLVGAGVDASRLTARGLGETQPLAPNTNPDGSDDPEGRAQNRRVEVVIEGVDLSAAGG